MLLSSLDVADFDNHFLNIQDVLKNGASDPGLSILNSKREMNSDMRNYRLYINKQNYLRIIQTYIFLLINTTDKDTNHQDWQNKDIGTLMQKKNRTNVII